MNYYFVVTIVLIFGVNVALFLSNKFRCKVYKLFLYAEKNIFTGTDRMEYVINTIYNYIPNIIKAMISKDLWHKVASKILQRLFDEIKDFLSDGKFDNKIGNVCD